PDAPETAQAARTAGTMLASTELPNAIGGATALAGPAVRTAATDLAERFPSTARAGGKFEKVMGAARDVALDTTAADEIAARAQELRQRGSTMRKVPYDHT